MCSTGLVLVVCGWWDLENRQVLSCFAEPAGSQMWPWWPNVAMVGTWLLQGSHCINPCWIWLGGWACVSLGSHGGVLGGVGGSGGGLEWWEWCVSVPNACELRHGGGGWCG